MLKLWIRPLTLKWHTRCPVSPTFTSFSSSLFSLYCSGGCPVSVRALVGLCSLQAWIVLPWMVVAVPGEACQLHWHQCSDSWFGIRSVRRSSKSVSVFLFLVLFKLRPAGVQSWWYGRLGKQEIAGPSRLILPTLPLAWHISASCCGHGVAASEARWRPWIQWQALHLICECVPLNMWSKCEMMAAMSQAMTYRTEHHLSTFNSSSWIL